MAYCAEVWYSFSLSFGGLVLFLFPLTLGRSQSSEFCVLFPTCDLSTLECKAHALRALGQLGLSCRLSNLKKKERSGQQQMP